MKFFIYKSFIATLLIILAYHATIGLQIRNIKIELDALLDKDKIEYLRNKIKKEIANSLKKDRILNQEDSKLLKNFLDKINKEIYSNNE